MVPVSHLLGFQKVEVSEQETFPESQRKTAKKQTNKQTIKKLSSVLTTAHAPSTP